MTTPAACTNRRRIALGTYLVLLCAWGLLLAGCGGGGWASYGSLEILNAAYYAWPGNPGQPITSLHLRNNGRFEASFRGTHAEGEWIMHRYDFDDRIRYATCYASGSDDEVAQIEIHDDWVRVQPHASTKLFRVCHLRKAEPPPD